jgi:hypothetical protein
MVRRGCGSGFGVWSGVDSGDGDGDGSGCFVARMEWSVALRGEEFSWTWIYEPKELYSGLGTVGTGKGLWIGQRRRGRVKRSGIRSTQRASLCYEDTKTR